LTWSEIGAGKYAMLTTYKKDGSPVGSPVWLAAQDDRIVVAANGDSWKIKRIRRNPNVTLQLCNARGTNTWGRTMPREVAASGDRKVRPVV
jgi:uncharacterized protein